jgi:hypothetical protein
VSIKYSIFCTGFALCRRYTVHSENVCDAKHLVSDNLRRVGSFLLCFHPQRVNKLLN